MGTPELVSRQLKSGACVGHLTEVSVAPAMPAGCREVPGWTVCSRQEVVLDELAQGRWGQREGTLNPRGPGTDGRPGDKPRGPRRRISGAAGRKCCRERRSHLSSARWSGRTRTAADCRLRQLRGAHLRVLQGGAWQSVVRRARQMGIALQPFLKQGEVTEECGWPGRDDEERFQERGAVRAPGSLESSRRDHRLRPESGWG